MRLSDDDSTAVALPRDVVHNAVFPTTGRSGTNALTGPWCGARSPGARSVRTVRDVLVCRDRNEREAVQTRTRPGDSTLGIAGRPLADRGLAEHAVRDVLMVHDIAWEITVGSQHSYGQYIFRGEERRSEDPIGSNLMAQATSIVLYQCEECDDQ